MAQVAIKFVKMKKVTCLISESFDSESWSELQVEMSFPKNQLYLVALLLVVFVESEFEKI